MRNAPARSRLTTACAGVTVLALVFAVIAGVIWWRSEHSAQRTLGIARDTVSVDARLDVATVNTSDYRQPAAALSNWLAVSTGSLHTQFGDSRSSAVKLLAEAKMTTRATVLAAAVTNLDLHSGTASVLVSVDVTRTPVKGAATTIRNRFRASMARVRGQWKLSDLAIVPVSLS